MNVTTVRDLGVLARASRRAQGMTQADLARRLGVSREWVVRFEGGHPRLEAQKVLDTLVVLGLVLSVDQPGDALSGSSGAEVKRAKPVSSGSGSGASKSRASAAASRDPFDSLFAKKKR